MLWRYAPTYYLLNIYYVNTPAHMECVNDTTTTHLPASFPGRPPLLITKLCAYVCVCVSLSLSRVRASFFHANYTARCISSPPASSITIIIIKTCFRFFEKNLFKTTYHRLAFFSFCTFLSCFGKVLVLFTCYVLFLTHILYTSFFDSFF